MTTHVYHDGVAEVHIYGSIPGSRPFAGLAAQAEEITRRVREHRQQTSSPPFTGTPEEAGELIAAYAEEIAERDKCSYAEALDRVRQAHPVAWALYDRMNNPTDDDTASDDNPAQEVHAEAKTHMTKSGERNYAAAVNAVLLANPDLKRRYNQGA